MAIASSINSRYYFGAEHVWFGLTGTAMRCRRSTRISSHVTLHLSRDF
jgi:hypothetical protein